MTCIFINFARVNTLCMQNHGFVSVSWECPRAKVLRRIAPTTLFSDPATRNGTRGVTLHTCAPRVHLPLEWRKVLIVHRHSPWCFIKATEQSRFLQLRVEFPNGVCAGNISNGAAKYSREKYSREIINCNSYQQIVWFNKINRIWMSQRMQMQFINHPVYILFFAENFNEKLRILNVP